jgi:uncharacterized protein (TIGR00725 family)
MNITIFGGSSPKTGSPAYQQAYQLGQLLVQAGHSVLTGGYIGTMEAVSRGAAEAGGHVIGVTCSQIEEWRPVKANAWVKEERKFNSLQERLNELISSCDGAMALPGGPGTLTEISLMWNLMIIKAIPVKPLILIGEEWKNTIHTFLLSLGDYIPTHQHELLIFANNIETACALLDE